MSIEQFKNRIEDYNNIAIFGAKNIAIATVIFLNAILEKKHNIKFCVTNKLWNSDELLGYPVCEISEIKDQAKDTYVLICVRKYHDEIKQILEENGFFNYSEMQFNLLRQEGINYNPFLSEYQCEMIEYLRNKEDIDDIQFATFIGRRYKPLALEMQVVGHCNLNCRSCCVFSPLANEEFMDIVEYEKDIKRIKEIIPDEKIERFTLVGGEPLLHPQLVRFIEIFRKYYNKLELNIFTNLIKLQNDEMNEFLDACQKYSVNIIYTRYPINIDYDKIEKKLLERNIQYIVFNSKVEEKKFDKFCHDLHGKYDANVNFATCFGNNPQIKNGKIYPCSIAPSFSRLTNFYGLDNICKNDGVDLYKLNSYEELLDRMEQPLYTCKYCGCTHVESGYKWQCSKKEMIEWTN